MGGLDDPDDLASAPTLATPRTDPRDEATAGARPTPAAERHGGRSVDRARPSGAVAAEATIGRFAVERKVGEGGMGAVYLAIDPTLGRRVAIKVLHQDAAGDDMSRRRLLREAQATAQLAHEHVVVVHEVGTHDDQVYLAMEYVAGATLKVWQAGRSWREVLAMYRRAGLGLQAAHDAGLVHRDFKPDNVLVGDDGRPRVTDFGLVAAVDDRGRSGEAAAYRDLDLDVSMTRTGTIMGTPRYMAPEQHLGEVVDARADQFAFCVALYEAWFHAPPFAGETYTVMVAHVLAGEVRPPPTTEVPAALQAAVLRGLSRQRAARFPSMAALLAALALDDRALRPDGPPAVATWRRPRVVLLGAALAAAIALVIGMRATRPRGDAGGTVPASASCPVPALDPGQVLPDAMFATLAASGQAPGAQLIRATLVDWRAARQRVCAGPAAEQRPRAACLDAVLSAIDASVKGLARIVGTPDDRRAAKVPVRLDGPELCLAPEVPNLRAYSPAWASVLAGQMRADAAALGARVHGLDELRAQVASDPCASAALELAQAWAIVVAPLPPPTTTHVEACDDDIVRRDLAAHDAVLVARARIPATTARDGYQRLVAAAARLPSARSKTLLLDVHSRMATAKGDWAAAIADTVQRDATLAAAGDLVSRVDPRLFLSTLRQYDGPSADPARALAELEEFRAILARDLPGDAVQLDRVDRKIALWMATHWREPEAQERLEQLSATPLIPNIPARSVTGRVVDGHGAPVVGAAVYADRGLAGSSFAAATATSTSRRKAITGPDGGFVIPDAVANGAIVAGLGSRRSAARALADEVELVLEDTSVIGGQVALNGTSADGLYVIVRYPAATAEYEQRAHVRPDGAFELRGIRRGKVVLTLADFRGDQPAVTHQVRELLVRPTVPAIRLTANPPRLTRVLIRSAATAPIPAVQVWIVRGRLGSGRLAKLQPALDAGAVHYPGVVEPAQLAALGPAAKPDDFYGEIHAVPPGAASVCAMPLLADGDAAIWAHAAEVEVRCAPIPADATPVVLAVPPLPRLD